MNTTALVGNNSVSQNSLLNCKSDWISVSTPGFSNSNVFLNDNSNYQNVSLPFSNDKDLEYDKDLEFEVCDNNNFLLSENGYPYALRCSDNFFLPITKSTRDILELWDKARTVEEFFISGDLVSNISCDDVIAISEKSLAMITHKFIDMVVDDPGMSKNFFHVLCNTSYFDHLVVEEAFTRHWINRFQNFRFSSNEARLVQALFKIISEKRGI